MAAGGIPAAEVDITVDLVRRLLGAQHPDLAGLSLSVVAHGWDNVIVRVGDDLVARLPRRQLGADLVAHEQRWLPQLASRLPLPIAAPVRVGVATEEYPWAWSVCPWFAGDVAADVHLDDPEREARRLAGFVAALHVVAPPDAPLNPYRGQPIVELLPRITANLERLADVTLASTIAERVAALAPASEWDGPPEWLHGDLHSGNLLVDGGEIVAVIDFGDITSGDPAVDLAVAWMLFDEPARGTFRDGAGIDGSPVDDDTWARAQLWGLHFGVLYLLHSADSERFARMGQRLVDALLRC